MLVARGLAELGGSIGGALLPAFLGLGKGGVGAAGWSGAASDPAGGPPDDAFVLVGD
jgi:hypothetical protein